MCAMFHAVHVPVLTSSLSFLPPQVLNPPPLRQVQQCLACPSCHSFLPLFLVVALGSGDDGKGKKEKKNFIPWKEYKKSKGKDDDKAKPAANGDKAKDDDTASEGKDDKASDSAGERFVQPRPKQMAGRGGNARDRSQSARGKERRREDRQQETQVSLS